MGDNITFEIEDIEQPETTLSPEYVKYTQFFEEHVPANAMTIAVKYNIPENDLEEFDGCNMLTCLSYIRSFTTIIACSAGKHIQGKNEIPHAHFHFIVHKFRALSNPSLHRTRWLQKMDDPENNLEGMSFQIRNIDNTKPKFQFLAYPLKENLRLHRSMYTVLGKPMSPHMIDFLADVGNTIFETTRAIRLRQEKCLERKQQALYDLQEVVRGHIFDDFIHMRKWLDVNYISTLRLDEYPDPKNYRINCQKIAIALGILLYSDIYE